MNIKEQVESRRDRIGALARQYGAVHVRLFGSGARGDERSDSDIDFLVDMKPGGSLFDLGALLSELERLFDRPVDAVTESGLKPRLRARVLREAVPII